MKSNYNKENHEMRYTLNKAINIALKDRNGEKTTDDIVIVMNDESGTTVYSQGHGKRITEYLIQTACKIFARSESQDFMETIADEPCDTEEFCSISHYSLPSFSLIHTVQILTIRISDETARQRTAHCRAICYSPP